MSVVDFHFSRRPYADRMVGNLMGDGIADYSSGLFLAAPRRTGKSTFLRRDLVPALQQKDIIPIYVDLWSDRNKDPAELIAAAIRQSLIDNGPALAKLAKRAGLSKLGLGSFVSFDLDRIGRPDGVTLADALRQLHVDTGRTIALIVDEAQHALSSENGINAMFGLKAARDALNQTVAASEIQNSTRLLLIFTGSHRDKLTNLVLRRDQPFYGATITNFPFLGRDFSDALTTWCNNRLAVDNQLDPDATFNAFKALGFKPEHLRQVITDVAFSELGAAALNNMIEEKAELFRTRLLDGIGQEMDSLTAVQSAVLGVLVDTGDGFAPFKAESLKSYSERAGREIEVTDVQAALDALRKKGLIWRSERSTYLLEDPAIAEVMRLRNTTTARKK